MSRNKTHADHEYRLTSAKVQLSSKHDWLDANVSAPSELLRFNPLDERSNTAINISQFGFRNPNDLKVFLRTPAGETIKGEISERIAEEQAIQNQHQFELQEQAARAHRLKALLFLYLIEKKGHASQKLRDFIEEQNEKMLKQNVQTASSSQKSTVSSKAIDGLTEAIIDYDKAIHEYQKVHDELHKNALSLDDELNHLAQQRTALIAKYEVYEYSLNAFDQLAEDYEQLNFAQLTEKIAELETQLHTQTEQIISLLDQGKEDEARELLNKQNALNLQIASLHDMRSTQQEDQKQRKIFFDEQGTVVKSSAEATFILPYQLTETKKIVQEHGQYYLIPKDMKLSDLSLTEKADAKGVFDSMSQEIRTVKKAVQQNRSLEMEHHDSRTEETGRRADENQSQLLMVRNQINLVQASRAHAQMVLSQMKNPELEQQQQPSPRPSMSSSAKVSLPTPSAPVLAFFQINLPMFKTPSLSSKLLFDQATKTNPKDAKEIKEFLKKALTLLGLGTIPSMAPLPQTTMDSLLKHMARFGADPNKLNPNAHKPTLAPVTSPLDTPKPEREIKAKFNPSPFSKTPFG